MVVPTVLAFVLAVVLGTAGRIQVGIRLDIMCRDGQGRGTYDCATLHSWLTAGTVGEMVVAVAAAAMLVLGLRRPASHRLVAISAWALIPLSLAWVAVTSLLGHSSY